MANLQQLALPISVGVAGLVGLGMVFLSRDRSKRKWASATGSNAEEFTCAFCHRPHPLVREDLQPLSPAEMGLVVRSRPRFVGHPMAEYVCPYCEAAHCFSLKTGRPELIGVNLYEPQRQANLCSECGKAFAAPTWAMGTYRYSNCPHTLPDCGLVCERCGAVSCVECARATTRNRGEDGTLLCPRCFRGPLERFHHL